MATPIVYGEIVNFPQFEDKIKRIIKAGINLKPAFVAIASDWFRSNKQMFMDVDSNSGAGAWGDFGLDLSENYKVVKPHIRQRAGYEASAYPILVLSGRLMDSVTRRGENSVYEVDDKHLVVGTNVGYGIYHQSSAPRHRLPHRAFLLNKAAQGTTRMQIFENNLKRWNRTIEEYVKKAVQKEKGI